MISLVDQCQCVAMPTSDDHGCPSTQHLPCTFTQASYHHLLNCSHACGMPTSRPCICTQPAHIITAATPAAQHRHHNCHKLCTAPAAALIEATVPAAPHTVEPPTARHLPPPPSNPSHTAAPQGPGPATGVQGGAAPLRAAQSELQSQRPAAGWVGGQHSSWGSAPLLQLVKGGGACGLVGWRGTP